MGSSSEYGAELWWKARAGRLVKILQHVQARAAHFAADTVKLTHRRTADREADTEARLDAAHFRYAIRLVGKPSNPLRREAEQQAVNKCSGPPRET